MFIIPDATVISFPTGRGIVTGAYLDILFSAFSGVARLEWTSLYTLTTHHGHLVRTGAFWRFDSIVGCSGLQFRLDLINERHGK